MRRRSGKLFREWPLAAARAFIVSSHSISSPIRPPTWVRYGTKSCDRSPWAGIPKIPPNGHSLSPRPDRRAPRKLSVALFHTHVVVALPSRSRIVNILERGFFLVRRDLVDVGVVLDHIDLLDGRRADRFQH